MSRLAHTKEEILAIYGPDSDEHKFVSMFFDTAQTAPLDALLVLAANRIASVKGEDISCEAAEQLFKSSEIIAKLGEAVVREHAASHAQDISEEIPELKPLIDAFLKRLNDKRQ